MQILIVDDDEAIRLPLTDILEEMGYKVVSAANGAEAWEIVQKEKVHVVITDWMMPKMDGLELTKRIRGADFSHYIYVIILKKNFFKIKK